MGEGMKRQTIKHLPEDLTAEILSNLPVKSIVRFKSVSKPWRSLISSAEFVKDHLNRSNSDPDLANHNLIGTFYDEETGLNVSSCSLKPLLVEPNQDDVVSTMDHPDIDAFYSKIIGSCNGLILIDDDADRFSLWNPSTREFNFIRPPSRRKFHRISRPSYGSQVARTDHSPWNHYVYGFGYDDSTDDYKVVWVINRSVQGSMEIHQTKLIYSVRTDSWKKIDNFEKGFQSSFGCLGTFLNGKLHWLGWLNVKEGGRRRAIASLGLVEGEEKFQLVAMPSNYLSLIGTLSYDGDINVWVMMKYGVAESWTKIWTLSDFHDPRPICDSVQPIWVTRNGVIFVVFDKSKVVVYNAKNKLREYRINKDGLESPGVNSTLSEDDHFYECSARLRPPLLVYVESLVSP